MKTVQRGYTEYCAVKSGPNKASGEASADGACLEDVLVHDLLVGQSVGAEYVTEETLASAR